MRRALGFLPDGEPLADPEAMLLIDHAQRQVFELHAFLDQRVRPNQDRELPFGQRRQHRSSRRGRRATHQQPDVDLKGAEDRLDDVRVLAGEDLGGRQQDGLEAGVGDVMHGHRRDDGLG